MLVMKIIILIPEARLGKIIRPGLKNEKQQKRNLDLNNSMAKKTFFWKKKSW